MSITRKKRAAVLAAGLTCLLAGYALAQQIAPGQTAPPTQPRPGEPQRATAGGASADVDRYLANCWQANNQAGIEISRIAQQRSQNPQVKQFAEKMVQEHSQLSQQLQQLAGGQRAQGATAGAQAAPGNQAIERLISIERQIVDRGSELMRQKLEEKQGAEFDQCYVGGQIACHMQASAALGVVSQEASGQLKQLASDQKRMVDQHLQEAEQLAEQLKGQQPGTPQARAARDPNLRPAGAEERR